MAGWKVTYFSCAQGRGQHERSTTADGPGEGGSGHPLYDGGGRGRALRGETVGVLEEFEGLLELRLVVVVDHHERLALLDLGADLLDLGHADRMVDLVVRALPAGAEEVHAAGDHRRVDGVDVSALGGRQLPDVPGLREFFRVVDVGGVPALGPHQLLEL